MLSIFSTPEDSPGSRISYALKASVAPLSLCRDLEAWNTKKTSRSLSSVSILFDNGQIFLQLVQLLVLSRLVLGDSSCSCIVCVFCNFLAACFI